MRGMLKTGLEFAPGTTNDCKKLIGRLFSPSDILGAYRVARDTFKSGDLALVVSEGDPSGFNAMTRTECVKKLRLAMGAAARKVMPVLAITHKPAHGIARLPFESDAFWLVVARKDQMPVMAVLFTTPYEMTAAAN